MRATSKLITSFIACLLSFTSLGQLDTGFVAHLEKNNLQNEFFSYLTSVNTTADSLSLLRMRYALRYQTDSVVFALYRATPTYFAHDTVLLKKISLRSLQLQNYKQTKAWFQTDVPQSTTDVLQQSFTMAEGSKHYVPTVLPEQLQYSFNQLKKADKKSPALAATLSALLPGAGKLYAGKTNSAFLTFVSCSAYALQWGESSKKLSYTHPLSIVNAAFFTAFYAANIYGSVKAVTQTKRERKQQFLYEVAHYYR